MSLIAPTRRRPRFHPLRVVDVEPLTAEAVALWLEVPPVLAPEFAFEAGQYLTVRAELDGQVVRRSYSCCLSPARARELGQVRVAARRVPGGLMSTWLTTQVRAGDELAVMGPLGDFTLPDRPRAGRHVAVAGGSGITPVLSLADTLLAEEPDARVTVLLANRDAAAVMFREELAALVRGHPGRCTVVHVLSRGSAGAVGSDADHALATTAPPPPPEAWRTVHGRLDGALLDELVAEHHEGAVDEWYLSGPSGLVQAVRAHLVARGVDPAHRHEEIFVAS